MDILTFYEELKALADRARSSEDLAVMRGVVILRALQGSIAGQNLDGLLALTDAATGVAKRAFDALQEVTLQRCQHCSRLTVANFCSMCFAGMAGADVDREYLAVLVAEESRIEMDRLAARAVLAGGRAPDWTGGGPGDLLRAAGYENLRNMIAQQQLAADMDMRSFLARLSRPRWFLACSRLWRRLRGAS